MNTRVLHSPLTGVQRYVLALSRRFGDHVETVIPRRHLSGIKGHAWEQFVLPTKVGGRLLFSPAITGPLAVTNQVVTIHDVVPLDHPEWLNREFAAWYRFLIPRLANRVARVITISEFSKQRLLAHTGLDEDRVTVIPNGVDNRFAPMAETECSEKLAGLALPCRHYVLCVGSLEPRKNLARLLEAWSRIQPDVPGDVWLVLAGQKGSERVFADRAGLARLPPRVHLTGHVPDDVLPALYAGARAFAYPSVYEGFGLPSLEAMAAGVPVLTGNQASLPEVVGEAGVMVDPYDVDALADGLLRLLDEPELRARLRQEGLERASQFTWDAAAEKTWAVLQAESS